MQPMPDPITTAITLRDFLIPTLSGAASFVGTWIAAKFALTNFYEQKLWEQKKSSYTAIFEAIHSIERWHEKNLAAATVFRDIESDRKEQLRVEANKAEEDLERRLAGEAWL